MHANVLRRDIVQYWTRLRRQVARRGGISYPELKALDVVEFFVTLAAYEAELKEELAAHNKAMKKHKHKQK